MHKRFIWVTHFRFWLKIFIDKTTAQERVTTQKDDVCFQQNATGFFGKVGEIFSLNHLSASCLHFAVEFSLVFSLFKLNVRPHTNDYRITLLMKAWKLKLEARNLQLLFIYAHFVCRVAPSFYNKSFFVVVNSLFLAWFYQFITTNSFNRICALLYIFNCTQNFCSLVW